MSQHLTLTPREEVLEPKRVMSVFRERVEKHKEEIAELEEREKLVEKEKPVSTEDTYWLFTPVYIAARKIGVTIFTQVSCQAALDF
jgi:hypothetical protein